MMNKIVRVLSSLLLPVALAQPQMGQQPNPDKQRLGKSNVIWQGQSSGFFIRWTPSNISVTRSNDRVQVLFSARSLAQAGLEEYADALRGDPTEPKTSFGDCSYERRFKLRSVVGSIVSVEDYEFSSCEREAHPEAYTRFTALNFVKGGDVPYAVGKRKIEVAKQRGMVKLTDFFPEAAVVKALRSDPLVARALQYKNDLQAPKTVAGLIGVFDDQGLSIQTGNGCSYSLPKDVLTRFAFHHVEGNNVAVRIGLLPDVGACRTTHAELGILLGIPESLKTPLALAESGKEGFLMKDGQRRFGDHSTVLTFKIRSAEYLHRRRLSH